MNTWVHVLVIGRLGVCSSVFPFSFPSLTSLAGFEEYGVVRCSQDGVPARVHDQDGHLEGCYTVLVAKAGETNLHHWKTHTHTPNSVSPHILLCR